MKPEESGIEGIADFFHAVERLKLEKRKGWVMRKVKLPESVADHSFRLALMAMVFADEEGLDAGRAVKLALVHDLPEAVCGDAVAMPGDEERPERRREKFEREQKALEQLLERLGGRAALEIRTLWGEFEERKTGEAILVYELDRLEAIFQAKEYAERQELKARMRVFFEYGNSRLRNERLRKVFGLLLKEIQGVSKNEAGP